MEDFRMNVPGAETGAPRKKSRAARLRPTKLKTWAGLILVLLILALAAGGYVYQTRKIANLKIENQRLSDPQQAAKQEADRLKNDVSKLIELPNETPTIATVVDVEKLKTQSFFANAQNGDRVLLFPQAKKAVLYRPNTKKIVEVAPINIGNNTGVAGASTETSAPAPTTKKP